MLYDTTFLVHFSGQRGRTPRAEARAFLEARPDSPIYTSRVAWAEFAEGCATGEEVAFHLEPFTVIEITEPIAWLASRISRDLDRRGLPIGDNDIWIAATAVAYRLPLVSRNGRHFARVPGLQVEEY
jgi:predicted nucleic acid-binding protein